MYALQPMSNPFEVIHNPIPKHLGLDVRMTSLPSGYCYALPTQHMPRNGRAAETSATSGLAFMT